MRIAFTGNHRRTLIFAEIAKHLTAAGHEVFWIATGSAEMSSILAPFDKSKTLTIDKSITGEIADFEQYSEITVNGIISSDRILQKLPYIKAVNYVSSCCGQIKEFLSEKNVELVFGEVTWAHEMVTAGICRELDILFLSPVNVRYPSERFAFFEGVFQRKIYNPSDAINLSEGAELYERFINCGSEPFYMEPVEKHIFDKLIYHIKRYLTGDTKDMTVPSIYRLIYETVIKKIRYKPSFSKPAGRFVYLPLQCSPESSIDVQAGYYLDQLNFVRAVSRSIPNGITLAVKPHPLGTYSRKFYRALLKIPSLQLVNNDSSYLIENAHVVVSISSTASYEAGLCGIPAVVFADMFYTELPTVMRCDSLEKLSSVIEAAIDSYAEKNAVITFLARLCSSTYEGYCESPDVYEDALSLSNISMVSKAFEDVVSRYSSSKSATAASM